MYIFHVISHWRLQLCDFWNAQFLILDCTNLILDCTKLVGLAR